jgi:transcription initiation factor TFIIIB Brf1 subunit/transcription initiation factor TFIIB
MCRKLRSFRILGSQLIQMALSKYKTITKVAEVLGVSQPTIGQRYQKLLNQEKE